MGREVIVGSRQYAVGSIKDIVMKPDGEIQNHTQDTMPEITKSKINLTLFCHPEP